MRKIYLDGVRGLAVLLVLTGHFSTLSPSLGPLIGDIAKKGVWIFFSLSSFLLTSQFINSANSFKAKSIISYFIRRIARIYPLYVFVVFLLLIDNSFSRIMFGGREWSASKNLFLIYPEGIFWSISVEFEYYLLIPLVSLSYFLFKKKFKNNFLPMLLGLACCIFLSIKLHQLIPINYFPENYPHLYPYLIIFLFGSFAAICNDQINTQKVEIKGIVADILIVTSSLLMFLGIPLSKEMFIMLDIEYAYHFIANPFFSGILSAIFILSINFSRLFTKLFSSNIMVFLGKISFSTYLLHIFCFSHLMFLSLKIGVPLTILVMVLATFSIAYVAYIFIENPVIRYINKLTTVKTF
jgi:peptidoglycan/LPS O-acetylase OafA/YrhL